MTESSARLALTITGTTATVAYILAMYFGLRGDQLVALALFVVAIADTIATFYFYRQYTRLRTTRWQSELQDSEQQMSDLLSDQPPSQKNEPTTDN
jgi:cell division protein FtsW (lipid II flippase)